MKRTISHIAIFLIVLAGVNVSSCKKSTVNPAPKQTVITGPILGYWYGTFLNDNGFGGNQSIIFNNDGTLKVYDFFGASSQTDTTVALKGTGTFTVSGNDINFSYKFPATSFTAQGTINTDVVPQTLQFTFKDPDAAPNDGSARMTKQVPY